MSSPEIQDSGKDYEVMRTQSTAYLCVFAALAYHYVTTIDEEVQYVWSQPRWKLGKVVFLGTRYSALILMAGYAVFDMPNYATLDIPSCRAVSVLVQVSTAANSTFTEASLWLCLYALLEGKPRYFYLVIIMLLGLTITIYVLQCLFTGSQKVIDRGSLDIYLGWPCAFGYPNPDYEHLFSIGMYLSAARSLVAIFLGLVTFVVRYRQQHGKLVRVIVREGGLYLALTLVLKLVIASTALPKNSVEDKYDIVWGLNRVFGNVFAERLILSLRKVDDPGTQAVISSLAFAITPGEDKSSDSPGILGGDGAAEAHHGRSVLEQRDAERGKE